MVGLEWKNKKSFFSKLKGTLEKQKSQAHAGLEAATDWTAEQAMRMTPRDTGALQDSQQVNEITTDPNVLVFEISYNKNGDVPYAIEQHIVPYNHNSDNNPPGAQNKYLEKAIFENPNRKMQIISEYVNFEKLE